MSSPEGGGRRVCFGLGVWIGSVVRTALCSIVLKRWRQPNASAATREALRPRPRRRPRIRPRGVGVLECRSTAPIGNCTRGRGVGSAFRACFGCQLPRAEALAEALGYDLQPLRGKMPQLPKVEIARVAEPAE
jgi:hypothetical protein